MRSDMLTGSFPPPATNGLFVKSVAMDEAPQTLSLTLAGLARAKLKFASS